MVAVCHKFTSEFDLEWKFAVLKFYEGHQVDIDCGCNLFDIR